MSPQVFYSLTLEQFEEALYQHSKATESLVRATWEAHRFSAANIMRPNLKAPSLPIDDILPLPWDDEDYKIKKALDRQAVGQALDILDSLFSSTQGDS